MRKAGLISAAVLALAVVGGWAATHTRSDAAGKDARIDPFLMMTHAPALPVEVVVDYSMGH